MFPPTPIFMLNCPEIGQAIYMQILRLGQLGFDPATGRHALRLWGTDFERKHRAVAGVGTETNHVIETATAELINVYVTVETCLEYLESTKRSS